MTAAAILKEIAPLGTEGYRKVMRKHGAPEPIYGVKIEELKKIQKRIKRDYQLALDLYDTGVYDAMYLAGLIAHDAKMTPENLQHWAERASPPLAGNIVAWVAAGSPHVCTMARRWIDSSQELIAVAGWATWSSYVSITADVNLDIKELQRLLKRVQQHIQQAPNAVRYGMNGFVICVGCYVAELTDTAIATAEKIGLVNVDMGDTACQVPDAAAYIRKVQARGSIGKKRKSAKC
jgi:3-methyladenine DNA glycosylase AlkD